MAKINISDLTVSRSQLEELSEQELAGIKGGDGLYNVINFGQFNWNQFWNQFSFPTFPGMPF